MKYWLALPLIVFSGCGLATLQCEGGFLGEIDDAALVQKIAKQSLEDGHFEPTKLSLGDQMTSKLSDVSAYETV